jgi:hypothetical protein
MDVSDIKQEFDKAFGDMCLSDNDVALHIFELGYKAGVAAENEACAKVCESLRDEDGYEVWGIECAAAIRARMKND